MYITSQQLQNVQTRESHINFVEPQSNYKKGSTKITSVRAELAE